MRHGRVYPKPTTWKRDHRKWLADQHFEEPVSEQVYLDLLARVDALTARKLLAARRGQPARDRPEMVAGRGQAALLSSGRHTDSAVDPS
ncbi:MAG: hypothetical protein ACXVFI_08405 [Solirubrobacteraceae bacterium]